MLYDFDRDSYFLIDPRFLRITDNGNARVWEYELIMMN